MAIFHYTIKIVGRSKGKSVISASAYIQHLCKHQYYRGLYYILHKLFSSYLISIFF